MAKIYRKLVRDKIPEIIRNNHKLPKTHVLSDAEYTIALQKKLQEEVNEFLQDNNEEELADILEVLYALAATLAISPQELEAIRERKATERGSFSQKIYLEHVEE
jgi:predicted house-cleaning noncanonical NTP pyrophosphatase (MazG superfamily)